MKRLVSPILVALVFFAPTAFAAPKHSRAGTPRISRPRKPKDPNHYFSHWPRWRKSGRIKGFPQSRVRYGQRLSRAQTGFYKRHPRNRAAEEAFERQTGYPHDRPGYVVDHIIPLTCGGADDPSNMQWQTIADAKAKDKWERKGCKK